VSEWVIIDTETTGLRQPIFPVEIAAQRMSGWAPVGKPFQAYLNFGVPIEPGAEATHGYTEEFLRKHGKPPEPVLKEFVSFVGGRPISSYNMAFDVNRVLTPTLHCLDVNDKIRLGPCLLKLARRLFPECSGHSQAVVAAYLNVSNDQTHHALDDVRICAQMIPHYGRELEKLGITTIEQAAELANAKKKPKPRTKKVKEVTENVMLEKPKKARASATPPPIPNIDALIAIGELRGICKMIRYDNKYTLDEVNLLADWLGKCNFSNWYPIRPLYDAFFQIIEDDNISLEEQKILTQKINKFLAWDTSLAADPNFGLQVDKAEDPLDDWELPSLSAQSWEPAPARPEKKTVLERICSILPRWGSS